MNPRSAIFCGALLAAFGVAAGAMGAHWLNLQPPQDARYEVAVRYLLFHSLGLMFVGLLGVHRTSKLLRTAGLIMLIGMILFSGGLFGFVASQMTALPLSFLKHVVPIGGVLMIAGWLATAAHSWSGAT